PTREGARQVPVLVTRDRLSCESLGGRTRYERTATLHRSNKLESLRADASAHAPRWCSSQGSPPWRSHRRTQGRVGFERLPGQRGWNSYVRVRHRQHGVHLGEGLPCPTSASHYHRDRKVV